MNHQLPRLRASDGRCRCQRPRPLPLLPPGSPSNNAPPPAPALPHLDVPTPPLGAPHPTMKHSWLTRWGSPLLMRHMPSGTTAQGTARSKPAGSGQRREIVAAAFPVAPLQETMTMTIMTAIGVVTHCPKMAQGDGQWQQQKRSRVQLGGSCQNRGRRQRRQR
jgi:hypothetical protein